MAGPLDLRGRVTIVDGASGTLGAIQRRLTAVGNMTGRAGRHVNTVLGGSARGAPAGGLGFGMTAFGFGALIGATKEWNDAIWGINAAFLASDEAMSRFKSGDRVGALDLAKKQTGAMRAEAMRLSREMQLLPEVFAKAGMEAAKMGLDFEKSKAVMRAAGAVSMSDRDADASDMAKALGTYGILYGQEEDRQKYAQQVYERASALAYGGAVTRTSASAIEEGARNFMGIHGAFGGQFEDLIALIASGSQAAQFEKVTGTSLKQLQARFLRMPATGYAALAGAGIDLKNFMDFGAVDPMRATNNIIQSFPQQLGKGARGKLHQFLEKAQRDGRLQDPAIVSETMAHLERSGLKFAGDEDRDAAYAKLSAIMSGVGGKFDIIGLFAEVSKAVKEGRAGPGIFAQIGDPRRIHEYLAQMRLFEDMLKLREAIKNDDGHYLRAVELGFKDSEAGKVANLLAALQRLQVALMTNDGFQMFVGGLASILEWLTKLPPELVATGLGLVGVRAAFSGLAWVFGGFAAGAARLIGVFAGGGGLGALAASALFAARALKMLSLAGLAFGVGKLVYDNWKPIEDFLNSIGLKAGNAATEIERLKAAWAGGDWRDAARWLGGKDKDGNIEDKGVLGQIPGVYGGAEWLKDLLLKAPSAAHDFFLGTPAHGAELNEPAAGGLGGGARTQPLADAQSIAAQVRDTLTLDLYSTGYESMSSYAAGLAAAGAQAVATANRIVGQVRAASQKVQLNTGPNMMPAR